MSLTLPSWSPTTTATSTTLTSIATDYVPALQSSLSAAINTLTETKLNRRDFIVASRVARGAQASLAVISAEEVLATATADSVKAQATQAIWDATENLNALFWEMNVYDIHRLSRPANIIFLAIFSITFLYTVLMLIKSRYHWFNVAFTCGTALEFLGFLGRVLSFGDMANVDYFLLQLVCLTLAPAFLMGGIYFLFGQLVVIHGRQFSWLKPLHYSYIFIGCDVLSLVIQAAGGGQASIASQNYQNAKPGTNTMIAGIAFQVFAMSFFLIFWFIFWYKVYFNAETPSNEEEKNLGYTQQYQKKSFINYIKLMFNGKNADQYKRNVLEKNYNEKYASIRSRPLYNYYALAISVAVITIYIRCVYRVVELAQGFSGYLITHEAYVMTLDAAMIAIAVIVFMPFHPQIVMGSSNVIKLKSISNNHDEQDIEDETSYTVQRVGEDGEVVENGTQRKFDSDSTWSPSTIPTSTTLSSINPTNAPALVESFSSALERAFTETDYFNLLSLSQVARGAQASMTVISAEQVLATATNTAVQASASEAIFEATVNLKALEFEKNLFNLVLNRPANIIYLIVYFVIFIYIALMLIKSRYWWYNVTFFCGYGLEFIGFLGRVLAFSDDTNMQFYLMQIICLTIAPAFIMAGIYFLFAQLVVIHGRQYSVLKPMWYSYFFIATDVLSLLIQAGGGASASVASSHHEDTTPGTNTMIAGIVVQVSAMTVFLVFWFEFLNRIYFKNGKVADDSEKSNSPYSKRSFANAFRFLFNVKAVREYRHEHLEKNYNPKFASIRQRKLFDWMPLAMTVAVVVIYIRCVYRVVELAQGFHGFLIEHEVFLMVLDALMIAIAGLIFIPFHPVWIFGKENIVKLATIKKNQDEHKKEDEESFEIVAEHGSESQEESSREK
ncbi:Sphingoid long-chain base transporter RSB1 [Spathaspora sp. JA1]|nr:Sphingoid long-chain base transporter RSB1 [Spathaspora sp. JA1]